MANISSVYQQVHTVSIPKEGMMNRIIMNDSLSKKDLRVVLMLLTELNGWSSCSTKKQDPQNYKKIDPEEIAQTLGISKSNVKKSLKVLETEGIIEKGGNATVKNGYRFTF